MSGRKDLPAMNQKVIHTLHSHWLAALMIGILVVGGALLSGCTTSSDTAGFKAEKKQSREEIQKQIAQIKADPRMPPSVKAMALQKLEKDLATAR